MITKIRTSIDKTKTKGQLEGLVPLLGIAIIVGCVAGIGAFVFRCLIGLIHNLSFNQVFSFFYESNEHTTPTNPFWIPLITLPLGAVLVTWLVRSFAPEAKGHGVPEVLNSVHFQSGRIRPAVVLVKALASSISIGTGGSVGREGPIVQIGSAFGSSVGVLLGVGRGDRTILLAAGAGAGIAATFNAPLGGILFAVEMFLLALNMRAVATVVLAVVPAAFVGRMLMGQKPSFDIPALQMPDYAALPVQAMLIIICLGLLVGVFSTVFIRGLYMIEDAVDEIKINEYVRNAAGMALVALIVIFVQQRTGHYYIQGVSYSTIMDVLTGALSDPLLLLTLAVLKLLVTSMTLGFGGSGGIFSPSLTMGACIGAAFGSVVESLFPGVGISVPSFALVGMAAMAGATTGAFFASILMIVEMSGNSNLILPVLLGTTVAWVVRRALCEPSIYTLKLLRRGLSVPESYGMSLMSTRTVSDLMVKATISHPAPADAPDQIEGAVIQKGQDLYTLSNFGVAHDGAANRSYILAAPRESLSSAIARRDQDQATTIVVLSPEDKDILYVICSDELSADYAALTSMHA